MNENLPKTIRRFASIIADVDRDPDGCWFVALNHGWYCPETETHLITDMRLSDVSGKLRSVVPCSAATCNMANCGPFKVSA